VQIKGLALGIREHEREEKEVVNKSRGNLGWSIDQAVEHLLFKGKALSSNPSSTKKKNLEGT
jgi:hypothetical protein